MRKQKLSTAHIKRMDFPFLSSILILLFFGIVMVYNVSVVYAHNLFGGKYYFFFLQSAWVLFGLAGMYFFSLIDYHNLPKIAFSLIVVCLICLVFVLLPTPFSPEVYGAQRWIILNPSPLPQIPFIGRLGFQPSELAKFGFILYFAAYLSGGSSGKARSVRPVLAIALALFALIIKQPDFGTTLLIFGIGSAMYFASGASLVGMLIALPIAIVGFATFILVAPHSRQRLITYLGLSGEDIQGSSYHINQILIALGSGGLMGVGFGASRQKYQYIPEVATDSIFAIIGEELGFVGLVFLIFLLVFIIYRGFKIAKEAPDMLGRLLATGVTSWFAVQTFVNLGAMVHLIPLTGVPLPLISYGGSSMVFGLAGLGVLLSISKFSKAYR